MEALRIGTTRAPTLVVSSDTIIRDKCYDGNIKPEKIAIVSRTAESFIR